MIATGTPVVPHSSAPALTANSPERRRRTGTLTTRPPRAAP